MKNITKRSEYVYEIDTEGYEDQNGGSTIKGVLMFKENDLSICFDKLHDNRDHAGQTGKWDLLIYEGYSNGAQFTGEWYYEGFRGDSQYSGEMKIIQG